MLIDGFPYVVINKKCYMKITDCSKMFQITYQAVISFCVTRNVSLTKLRSGKKRSILYVDLNHFKAERQKMYDRSAARYNGSLKVDPLKEELTIKQAAKLFGISRGELYYRCTQNQIPYVRKGKTYVLHRRDVQTYAQTYERFIKKSEKPISVGLNPEM